MLAVLAAAGLLAAGSALLAGGFGGSGGQDPASRPGRTVFFGDSITEFCDLAAFYPGLDAVNRGVAGDTTGDMLRRLDRAVYAQKPGAVVILGGINDLLSGYTADQTAEDLLAIVRGVRENLPEAAVVVQSVYPVAEGSGLYMTGLIREVNGRLEAMAEELGYRYADVFGALCTADGQMNGEYSYDGLHPNDAGYQAVRPVLTAALETVTARGLLG